MKRVRLALALACAFGVAAPGFAAPQGHHPKLDNALNVRASGGHGTSRVIVTVKPGRDASVDVRKLGGKPGKRLGLINGQAVEMPNAMLRRLADTVVVPRRLLGLHRERNEGEGGRSDEIGVLVAADDVLRLQDVERGREAAAADRIAAFSQQSTPASPA